MARSGIPAGCTSIPGRASLNKLTLDVLSVKVISCRKLVSRLVRRRRKCQFREVGRQRQVVRGCVERLQRSRVWWYCARQIS